MELDADPTSQQVSPTQELYDWLHSLICAMPYVAVPKEPGPPAYDEISAGEEFDLRCALHAYERISPADRADGRVEELWQSLGAWIAAHNAHCWVGYDLCREMGVAIGQVPEEGRFPEEPTDPVEQVTFRIRWVPDVEADIAAQRAEMVATLEMLRRQLDPREFVALLSRGDKVVDLTDLFPPLALDAADDAPGLDAAPRGLDRDDNGERGEEAVAVAAPPMPVSARRHWCQRWLAGGTVTALAVLAAVALANPEPAAALTRLPLSSAYDYPVCPDDAESAGSEDSNLLAGGPLGSAAIPSAGATRHARALPSSVPRRRKVSAVRLTDTGGVVVRQEGKRDLLITAQEVGNAPARARVIHAEEFSDTVVDIPILDDGRKIAIEL